MVLLHAIAATPPTVAAVAAVITSLRTAKRANEIHILVNGDRERLRMELEQARAQLARKE